MAYIAFGTFIYTSVFEALDAVDALYFTIVGAAVCARASTWCVFLTVTVAHRSQVTLTTVGYGDICPSSDGSKLFTIAFSFIGVVQIGVAFEVGGQVPTAKMGIGRALRQGRASSYRVSTRPFYLD